MRWRAVGLALVLVAVAPRDASSLPAGAAVGDARSRAMPLPVPAREADLEERLGARVPMGLAFTGADGRAVTLGEALGGAPAVITLAYYHCPSLCGLVLRGLARGFADAGVRLGERRRAVTVSIDPTDGPADAARAQATALSDAGQPGAASAWPFLVGDAAASRALADALGFRYARDPATGQFAHPAASFVVTADGRVARVLYGTKVPPIDLRLALVEASEGRVGDVRDRVLATCFRYDPAARRYGPAIAVLFRGGGLVVTAVLGGLAIALARRERARRRARP